MKIKGLGKKPTKKKILWQSILSIILISWLFSMIESTWEMIAEEDRGDLRLQSKINDGEYASCVDWFDLYYGLGETSGKEYDKFQEFFDFYEFYILGVEYQGAGGSVRTPAYEAELRECLTEMRRICEDTQYPEMVPHYEYLISALEEPEAGSE